MYSEGHCSRAKGARGEHWPIGEAEAQEAALGALQRTSRWQWGPWAQVREGFVRRTHRSAHLQPVVSSGCVCSVFCFFSLQRHSHTVPSLVVKASFSTSAPDGRCAGELGRRPDGISEAVNAAPPGKPHCGLNAGPRAAEGPGHLGTPTAASHPPHPLLAQHSWTSSKSTSLTSPATASTSMWFGFSVALRSEPSADDVAASPCLRL